VLSTVPVLGNAFTTKVKAKTRTELVFLVTVNAEEPPALVPINADGPAPLCSVIPAFPSPAADSDGRHIERFDALGYLQ
jgi:hypothetical protein